MWATTTRQIKRSATVPTIQLYHHQSQLRSQAGPRANPNVFGAQTAQALAQVSEQIGQLGQKLADTADYRALTEYQLEEQDFQAKQEKWLLANPHAEKDDILKRYRVERDAFNQSQLKKKHLSKRARERIGLLTQAATAKGDLATTQVARTREIKRAQALSATVKQQSIDAGDLEAFTLRVDQDIEHGITAPELRDAEINHAKQQIQQGEVMRMVNTDPMQAKQLLEERDEDGNPTQFDAIDEATRYTLINHAERNFSQLSVQTYESISERMDGGEVIGDKELDDLVARRFLTSKHAKALRKYQSGGKSDKAAYDELFSAIINYDPATDQNQTDFRDLLWATAAMPTEHRADLKTLLKEKQKGSSPLNSPAAKEEFKRIEKRFNKGFYGNFKVPKTDEKGKVVYGRNGPEMVDDQKLWEEAVARQVEVEEALIKFLLENPNATRSEITQFVREYQTTEMTMSAYGMLSGLANDDEEEEDD